MAIDAATVYVDVVQEPAILALNGVIFVTAIAPGELESACHVQNIAQPNFPARVVSKAPRLKEVSFVDAEMTSVLRNSH